MELELKHIACYLPYRLEGVLIDDEGQNGAIGELYRIETGATEKNKSYDPMVIIADYEDDLTLFKPYLRPLEDLTKEIEHNGEKFVPIDRLSSEFSIRLGGTLQEMNVISIGGMELEDLELLLSLHFDIYSLIPKGLALPKP